MYHLGSRTLDGSNPFLQERRGNRLVCDKNENFTLKCHFVLTLLCSKGHNASGPNDPGKFDHKDILHVSELPHLPLDILHNLSLKNDR